MIKDRGNIKWNSLMLVEHKRRLRELKESEQDRELPELDEQEKERLDRILRAAREQGLTVEITYHREKRFHTVRGKIKKYLSREGKLLLQRKKESRKIAVERITNVFCEKKPK